MRDVLLVFLGGGSGAVLRWALKLVVPAPWGTMLVNVVGSFLLAFLVHQAVGLSSPWRLLLLSGLMGGFTTYSTFSFEVFHALHRGQPGLAAVVALGTFSTCLFGSWAGWTLATWWGS